MREDLQLMRWGRAILAGALLLTAGEMSVGIRAALADSTAPAASSTQTPAPAPAAPAAPAPAATPAPPSDLVLPAMNIHMKGFVDVYGQYNPTSSGYSDFRAYDYGANSFNVNMAQLKIWRPDDDGVGFVLRADFGPGAYASGQLFAPGYYGALGGHGQMMPYTSFWLE